MKTFVVLLLAHLLGDFPLQTNRIFRMKLANKRGLSLHIAIHVLTAAILIENWWLHWPVLLVLGIVHFFTDYIKIKLQKAGEPLTPGFIADQIAHVITIILLAMWQPSVMSILSDWLLLTAVIFAIIPAIMTLLWVWANDHYLEEDSSVSAPIEWISKQLLPISQRFGWGIMIGLLFFQVILS